MIAAIFLGIGFSTGEPQSYFQKAIQVCTQCIGLGLNLRFGVQAVTAAISNGYFKGFSNGTIYQGVLKHACVPTLNCYSCPGALFACPVGAAQVAIAGGGGLDVTATHSLKDRLNVILHFNSIFYHRFPIFDWSNFR